jgi:hypothetical protein
MHHNSIVAGWKFSGRAIYLIVAVLFMFLGAGSIHQGENLWNFSAASASSAMQAYDVDVPILAYHKVELSAPTTWYVTVDQFTEQMEVLKAYGYQTIGLRDFLDYRDGTTPPPEHPLIVTFDDGYQGIYDYAYQFSRQGICKLRYSFLQDTLVDRRGAI